MNQELKFHQLLKDLFQLSTENKKFNMASNWEELGASLQNICLREISFIELMEITKGWNPNSKFKLLEERVAKIRENQATIQAIEEQWSQKENILTASGSQAVGQTHSPVALHHSEYRKEVANSHHPSQFQEVPRRRQGLKGNEETSFSQRKKESDPIIQRLLELVKEFHRN
ncbi:hypothetical protein O181_066264 [Austropuccinia psidii MF-1]|uniref:Uncharacterized protein n=1 Tax=Austropuccinia psidii MF-1 TaxID=1389203 RepID=A0A9Q3ET49_9BASI|nr:hypothetical protein [Austropuccinia psidii MF-1]